VSSEEILQALRRAAVEAGQGGRPENPAHACPIWC